MKYTKVASNAFQLLQMNAGVVLRDFDPSDGSYDENDILGATTGGITFNSNPSYEDFGEDVDNVPSNSKQLKRVTSYDPTISGTLLTLTANLVANLSGGADVVVNKITPRSELKDEDFDDIWFVGDYSDKNTGAGAGFVAIHVMNALNTTGFQLQTTKNGKGQCSFEYHGHYDLDNIDTVPFEIYVKQGIVVGLTLNKPSLNLALGGNETLIATKSGITGTVTWASSDTDIATVNSDGKVTADSNQDGTCTITASCEDTETAATYTATCTVTVSLT